LIIIIVVFLFRAIHACSAHHIATPVLGLHLDLIITVIGGGQFVG